MGFEDSHDLTSVVYGHIRDADYDSAIRVLESLEDGLGNRRAKLSLLAFCKYHCEEYEEAAKIYRTLCDNFPESYRINEATCMYLVGDHEAAASALASVPGGHQTDLSTLLDFECGIDQSTAFDCVRLLRSGKSARNEIEKEFKIAGRLPWLLYSSALSARFEGRLDETLLIANQLLRDNKTGSRIHVAAQNLKSAVLFDLGRLSEISDFSQDEALDAVSLHNKAVLEARRDGAFREASGKFWHLLSNDHHPEETLGNFISILLKAGKEKEAAEVAVKFGVGSPIDAVARGDHEKADPAMQPFLIARSLYSQGKFEEASSVLTNIEVVDKTGLMHTARGHCYLAAGQYEKALEQYRAGTENGSEACTNGLVTCLLLLGQIKEAEEYAETCPIAVGAIYGAHGNWEYGLTSIARGLKMIPFPTSTWSAAKHAIISCCRASASGCLLMKSWSEISAALETLRTGDPVIDWEAKLLASLVERMSGY